MKNWRGGVKFQRKLRIPSSKFSHLWADHLAGPSSFSYAQLISTPCLQYIGFIRLGFLKVRVLLKNPFYQTSQCKTLNNKLSGWKLISVVPAPVGLETTYVRHMRNASVAYFGPHGPTNQLCKFLQCLCV